MPQWQIHTSGQQIPNRNHRLLNRKNTKENMNDRIAIQIVREKNPQNQAENINIALDDIVVRVVAAIEAVIQNKVNRAKPVTNVINTQVKKATVEVIVIRKVEEQDLVHVLVPMIDTPPRVEIDIK